MTHKPFGLDASNNLQTVCKHSQHESSDGLTMKDVPLLMSVLLTRSSAQTEKPDALLDVMLKSDGTRYLDTSALAC